MVIGPALSMGGMERASATIANTFASLNKQTIYLSIFKKAHFFKLSADVVLLEPKNFNVTHLSIFKTIKWIRSSVRTLNPETILVYNKFYAAITMLALIGTNRKVFISERSSPFYRWKPKYELINRIAFLLNSPSGIISQTNIAAQHQKKYYRKNVQIQVIPNALRPVALYPEIKRENWILAVGRLDDALKGFDQLIVAFSKIKNAHWKLVFAGGDENGKLLKEQARALGILDNILFLGKVENIDKIYAQASIFVIPSRSEGFPNALCEAMAAGLPCISFDFIAGPRDIITDGVDGIIVENHNTDLLAQAIENLIDDPDLRNFLSNNAMNIISKLDHREIGREMLNFILK